MNESRAPRDQPLGRWQTGASQLSLVEHAICPLDSQTSLQQNLRHSSEYRYALVRRQLLTILRGQQSPGEHGIRTGAALRAAAASAHCRTVRSSVRIVQGRHGSGNRRGAARKWIAVNTPGRASNRFGEDCDDRPYPVLSAIGFLVA